MGLTLTGIRIEAKLTASYINTLDDGSSTSISHPNGNYKPTMANGLNANQANRGWQSKNRDLPNASNETLDIYDLVSVDIGAGTGKDGLGQSITFEEIVGIMIVNENAVSASGQLEIEAGNVNGWDAIGEHTVTNGGALKGQGCLFKSQVAEAGLDITDASAHTLKFTASGGDVTYSIYILARHDDNESSSSSSSSSSQSSSSSSSSSVSSSSSSSSSSTTHSSGSSSSPSSVTSYSSSTT